MNKNLYRGKQLITKLWVEGYHVVAEGQHYISLPLDIVSAAKIEYQDSTVEEKQHIELATLAPFLEVIPETVGQCTGKLDKNKKKIYDGDIIKISGHSNYYAIVEYDESCGCYYAVNYEVQIPAPLGNLKSEFIEVAGNIYDDEELMNVRYKWWRSKDGR